MLAAMNDYLHNWQLPFIGLFLLGWLVGGGWLMARFMKPHVEKRRAGVGRGMLIMLLAGAAAAFAMGVVAVLFRAMDQQFQTSLFIFGSVLGVLLGLLVAYVVVYTMLPVNFVRAVAVSSPAFGGVLLLAAAIGVGVGIPSYAIRQREIRQDQSRANLRNLYQGLQMYHRRWSTPPQQLQQLLVEKTVAEEHLLCPSAEDPARGYFYYPQPARPESEDLGPILICELAEANDGAGRLILRTSGEVEWKDADAFREELASPRNAAFAEALKAAEGD